MTHEPDAPDWITAQWIAAGTAAPSLLERQGRHEMRAETVQWCRRHPQAARALPGWSPHVLAGILEPPPPPDAC